jgi:hypothetical protein
MKENPSPSPFAFSLASPFLVLTFLPSVFLSLSLSAAAIDRPIRESHVICKDWIFSILFSGEGEREREREREREKGLAAAEL